MLKQIFWILLFIPTVSAGWGASVEGGVQSHTVDTYVQSRTDPPTGDIYNNSVISEPVTIFAVNHTHSHVKITYTATVISSANGRWDYNFYVDGVLMPQCGFSLVTIDIPGLANSLMVVTHDAIWCELTATGNFTFRAERVTGAGTPDPLESETISYEITRYDHLEPDTMNDLIEAINLTAPLLAFAILIIWAEKTGEFLIYIVAAVAGLTATITVWDEIASLRVLVVAAIIFIIMRSKQAYDMTRQEYAMEDP